LWIGMRRSCAPRTRPDVCGVGRARSGLSGTARRRSIPWR
jgi:hypothetical protein